MAGNVVKFKWCLSALIIFSLLSSTAFSGERVAYLKGVQLTPRSILAVPHKVYPGETIKIDLGFAHGVLPTTRFVLVEEKGNASPKIAYLYTSEVFEEHCLGTMSRYGKLSKIDHVVVLASSLGIWEKDTRGELVIEKRLARNLGTNRRSTPSPKLTREIFKDDRLIKVFRQKERHSRFWEASLQNSSQFSQNYNNSDPLRDSRNQGSSVTGNAENPSEEFGDELEEGILKSMILYSRLPSQMKNEISRLARENLGY